MQHLRRVTAIALIVLFSHPVSANLPPDEVRLDRQMARASFWGLIRVTEIRFLNVPLRSGADPATLVDFDVLDLQGATIATKSLWHAGADTEGGVLTSRMPHFSIGDHYVVVLQAAYDRLELIADSGSVLPVETLAPGQISPWDAVRLMPGHQFIPPGAHKQVADAQLYEILDGLAILQQRVNATGDAP